MSKMENQANNKVPKEKIVPMRRMPPRRIMYALPLGLTFGLVLAWTNILLQIRELQTFSSSIFPGLVLLIVHFFLWTWYFGWHFFWVSLLVGLLPAALAQQTFLGYMAYFSRWYVVGYISGYALAIVYNLCVWSLVQVYYILTASGLIPERKHRSKISFAYEAFKELNIIKSPMRTEEVALIKFIRNIPYLVGMLREQKAGSNGPIERKRSASRITKLVRRAYKRMPDSEKKMLANRLERIQTDLQANGRSAGLSEISADHSSKKQKPSNSEITTRLKFLRAALLDHQSDKYDEILNKVYNQQADPEEPDKPLYEFVEERLNLESKRQYAHNLGKNDVPEHPYTILFVANPSISRSAVSNPAKNSNKGSEAPRSDYVIDPINDDLDLFYKTVDRALMSFEQNEVLGKPEIWSRIRVMTLCNTTKPKVTAANCFVDGLPEAMYIGEQLAANLLVSTDRAHEKIKNWVRKACQAEGLSKRVNVTALLKEIDVIYIVSASDVFIRSTASFTDEGLSEKEIEQTGGKEFNAWCSLPAHIAENIELPKRLEETYQLCHERFATIPGIVALNALSSTEKTFVHEFAHAMSHPWNGAIADEYADIFDLYSERPLPEDKPFYINRIDRKQQPNNPSFVPVPPVFMQLDGIDYQSDINHPSAGAKWVGYFPERFDPGIPCTMDASTGLHMFDKLLNAFIYYRLAAKLNRKG